MGGIVPQTIWFHNDVGNTQEAKKEVMAVVPSDAERQLSEQRQTA